jgi:hypothetical protein
MSATICGQVWPKSFMALVRSRPTRSRVADADAARLRSASVTFCPQASQRSTVAGGSPAWRSASASASAASSDSSGSGVAASARAAAS